MELPVLVEDLSELPVRERNKVKKVLAMLSAARRLILSHGIEKTTMDAIAEEAEVGVATVYKYFGTKDNLLLKLAREDMGQMLDHMRAVAANPPSDPTLAVISTIAPSFELELANAGPNVVRFFMDEFWIDNKPERREFAQQFFNDLEEIIESLLLNLQRKAIFCETVDIKVATRIIHSLVDYNYLFFARGEIPSVQAMSELTYKQVEMLIRHWRAN